MKVKSLLVNALLLLITGCATYKPAPEPKGTPFPINKPIVTTSDI